MPNKIIEVGKFYFIHDGSKSGHPGFVIWKDDEKNRYLVVRFDSDKYGDIPKIKRGVRHITLLPDTTSKKVMNSYVRNRPMLCKRKDFGSKLDDLVLSKSNFYIVIKVSMNKPEYSPSLRK